MKFVFLGICLALIVAMPTDVDAKGDRTVSDLSAASIEGAATSLATFKGKVILIVNTASDCGYTPQYEALQALYSKYAPKGFVVLGFPSNDFGGQEPGTNGEIKTFCKVRYKVDFPLFSKAPVSGKGIQPVFAWLTSEARQDLKGPVKWNFEKFLIGRDGKLKKRFKSQEEPDSQELLSALEAEIASKPAE